MSFLALCLGFVSCYDDTAIWERFEALETTRIATIDQQVESIKSSIADLEATDKELDAAIAALIKENDERDEQFQADIDSLKAKDRLANGGSAEKDPLTAAGEQIRDYENIRGEQIALSTPCLTHLILAVYADAFT